MSVETPFVFHCGDAELLGILHRPAGDTQKASRRGVVIVVGGPQYRVGAHRQFLLLARALAAAGHPVLRMDYRGMGDSGGVFLGFEHIGQDIRAAIDAFFERAPEVEDVVLWGLCDAASALCFYAAGDDRVRGLVLVNPWVRTVAGAAKARLKHYYLRRLASAAFWRKLFAGKVDPVHSARDLAGHIGKAYRAESITATATPPPAAPPTVLLPAPSDDERPLPERMGLALEAFRGPVLLVISGNDLTASEFLEATRASRPWQRLLSDPRFTRKTLPPADHTFSRAAWREQLAAWTREWLGRRITCFTED